MLFRWGRLVIDVTGSIIIVCKVCNQGLVSLPHLHTFVVSRIEPRVSYVSIDVVGVVGSFPKCVQGLQLSASIPATVALCCDSMIEPRGSYVSVHVVGVVGSLQSRV